jgi:hypothetical protein
METLMDDRPERNPIEPPAPRGPDGSAQASPLAHHRDPSLPEPVTPADDSESSKPDDGDEDEEGKKGRERIEWVRAMDVLTGRAGRQAGRAAPRLEAGVRRARAGMGRLNPISRQGIARRSAPTTTQTPLTPPGAGSGRQDRDQGPWL